MQSIGNCAPGRVDIYKNGAYIERLDHLRLFAATLVMVFHLWLTTGFGGQFAYFAIPLIRQGHIGVQFFMVISGFVLAVISYGKHIEAVNFYKNRVLRIYPLFVFVLALGYFSTPDPRPTSVSVDFLVALTPFSNLSRLQYGEFGGQLWSVAVELQFYLLFPIFQSVLLQKGARYHIILIAFMVIIRAAVFLMHGTVHQLSYFSIFGALDVFLVGHLLGWYYRKGKLNLSNPLWLFGSFAFLNFLVWAAFRGSQFFHVGQGGVSSHWFWIIWPDVAAAVSAVLIVSYLQCRLPIPFSGVLSALGRYSYSIYLWHIMVMSLCVQLSTRTHHYWIMGLVIPATFAVSALSYHVIERPFLARRVSYLTSRA